MTVARHGVIGLVARALTWVPAAALFASSASAHFEGALLSTRTASLGGAFVAIADDPSATVDNPAGLSGCPTLSFLATYRRPFGVDGLDDGYLAVTTPLGPIGVGGSWFHRGLVGALSEDLFTLSVARDLKRTSEDASLSIGASIDIARVSARDEAGDAATAVALGAGVLLRPFAFIGIGYSIRNVNEPEIDLVEGGATTALRRAQAIGLAYYWQERLVVTVETRQDTGGEWRNLGGAELRVGRHLALRGGMESSRAAVGVGITSGPFVLDAGMTGHEALGSTYMVSLRYTQPGEKAPYGMSR